MTHVFTYAKAALVSKDGRILILTRSAEVRNRPNELDLPGGMVDDGEDIYAGLLRELNEEIGMTMTMNDVRLVFAETAYHERQVGICLLFVGYLDDATDLTLSNEHQAYAWMGFSEIKERFLHPVWLKGMEFAAEHGLVDRSLAG
jgi:8-oxo-dGTP pyrophosphatase MutT (NUDIX family)